MWTLADWSLDNGPTSLPAAVIRSITTSGLAKDDGWLDRRGRKWSDTLGCVFPMRKPAWKPSFINFAKALSGYISRYANKASRLTGD